MRGTLVPFGFRSGLFQDLHKEINQLFNQFSGENGGEFTQTAWNPRLNLSETESAYDVTVDLPGLKPEEVSVELKHGDLWITGERKTETEEKDKTWHRVERHYGQFRRVVRLG